MLARQAWQQPQTSPESPTAETHGRAWHAASSCAEQAAAQRARRAKSARALD